MWNEAESAERQAVASLIGKTISTVELVVYQEPGGALEDGDYAVQFSTPTAVLLLWGRGDGETLRVDDSAWVDPFIEPFSPENREYVARSGKWVKRDAPQVSRAGMTVGRRLVQAAPLRDAGTRLRGVALEFEGGLELLYVVAADEGRFVEKEEAVRMQLSVDL